MMEQIERITQMEQCLDATEKAIRELSEALSAFEEVQLQYRQLNDYYGSDAWMQDYEDDEAGKLPKDLKRGVLSEDAVYDLITENREIVVRMLRLVTTALESDGL
ncbi:MAG: DUF4298 domain-containing protein [Bacteroidales bacterium]|nr:DUF4298 domain-containing protein [Bacteroidales bacterium]